MTNINIKLIYYHVLENISMAEKINKLNRVSTIDNDIDQVDNSLFDDNPVGNSSDNKENFNINGNLNNSSLTDITNRNKNDSVLHLEMQNLIQDKNEIDNKNDNKNNYNTNNNNNNEKLKPIPIRTTDEVFEKNLKSYICLEKLFNNLVTLLYIILFVGFNVLYILSLEFRKCTKDYWYECRIKYDLSDFLFIVIFLICAAVVLTILIVSFYIYNYPRLLVILTFNLLLLFAYDTGYKIQSHGGYSRNFLLLLTSIFVFIYFFIYQIYKFFKTRYFLSVIFLGLTTYFGFVFLDYYIFDYSCKDFKKGLKGVELDNFVDKNCVTPVPKYCAFHMFDGIMDLPRWFNQDCADEKGNITLLIMNSNLKEHFNFTNLDLGNEEVMNKYIASKIKKISFPRGERFDRVEEVEAKAVQRFTLNRLIDFYNASKEIQDATEYSLVYNVSKNEFEPEIDLKYNKTLAELNKKKLTEEYNNNINTYKIADPFLLNKEPEKINTTVLRAAPLVKNVITMFFDATSRRHFMRKFPKMMAFLEKHYENPSSLLSSYQFLRHQTIYPGTLANLGAAYWGTFNKKAGVSINKKYRKFGFVTGSTQNMCLAEVIDIKQKEPTEYEFVPDDHDFWTPFCDPNQVSMKGPYVDFKGPYSVLKKCMWEKQSVDHSIEYMRQFFKKYKDNHKIFKFGTADDHETSAEVIKYIDEPLTNFLEELENDGTLSDTAVIIFSDHGTYSHGWIFRKFETADWEIELKLPGLFVLLPKKIKYFKQIDANLKSRMHTMTTAFDIHKTLLSILDGNEEKESYRKYGRGVFYNHLNDLEGENTCSFLGSNPDVCMCRPIGNVTKY